MWGSRGGEQAVDGGVLELVGGVGVEGELGLGEAEDLLEAIGRGGEVGEAGEGEVLAGCADCDRDLLVVHGGEELGGVQAQVGEGRDELATWVEAALVEVLVLDDVGGPDGEREATLVEGEEDTEIGLSGFLHGGFGLRGLAAGVEIAGGGAARGQPPQTEMQEEVALGGHEGGKHSPGQRGRGVSGLVDVRRAEKTR